MNSQDPESLNSIYVIGLDFYNGDNGCAQSFEKAVDCFKIVANLGYPQAQCKLGYCYRFGDGVEQSYEEAVKWFRLAADQGYAEAQCSLGLLYKNGNGVGQSYEQAVKWFRLAADQGDCWGQYFLGLLYKYGDGVEQSYEQAVKWFRLGAEGGLDIAQCMLGDCYMFGDCVELSYEEAVKWYSLAADQGDTRAQYSLGTCYEYGKGVKQSYKEAARWYALATDQGYEKAQSKLNEIDKKLVSTRPTSSTDSSKKVEDNSNKSLGDCSIGRLSKLALGGNVEAFNRLLKAANDSKTRGEALYYIGYFIQYSGVDHCEEDAIRYYDEATKNGYDKGESKSRFLYAYSRNRENICPRCGKGLAVRSNPRGGYFKGCSGYPKCDYTTNVSTPVYSPLVRRDPHYYFRNVKNNL